MAIRMSLNHRGALAVNIGSMAAYMGMYLWAIGHLNRGTGRFEIVVANEPFAMLFQQTFGSFTFEPVVLIQAGVVTYLFSLNTIIGLIIAVLVGVNMGISYLAWRQPKACGIGGKSAGVFAGIPALLSGTACCAPMIILLIGVQMSGALLTTFELLLPIAVLLLVGALFLVGRQVDPTVVSQQAA